MLGLSSHSEKNPFLSPSDQENEQQQRGSTSPLPPLSTSGPLLGAGFQSSSKLLSTSGWLDMVSKTTTPEHLDGKILAAALRNETTINNYEDLTDWVDDNPEQIKNIVLQYFEGVAKFGPPKGRTTSIRKRISTVGEDMFDPAQFRSVTFGRSRSPSGGSEQETHQPHSKFSAQGGVLMKRRASMHSFSVGKNILKQMDDSEDGEDNRKKSRQSKPGSTDSSEPGGLLEKLKSKLDLHQSQRHHTDSYASGIHSNPTEDSESSEELAAAAFSVNTGKKYSTTAQDKTDILLEHWQVITAVQRILLLLLFVICFCSVPIRIAIGSENLGPSLLIVDNVTDFCILALLGLNFIRPTNILGQIVHNRLVVARHYLHDEFLWDLTAGFPCQIILYGIGYGLDENLILDFARLNRLAFLARFSSIFDEVGDDLLSNVHPVLLRIIKFGFITVFYTLATAAPMHLVYRVEGEGHNWYGNSAGEVHIGTDYLRTLLHAFSLTAGRNFPNPATENQVIVMTFLSLMSLGSMAVIISGVTAMVIALVERTSKLSNKIDGVFHQLSHMRLPKPFIDEVLRYYHYMYLVFNTFDYNTSNDFIDELPIALVSAMNDQIHVNTVRSIPLFSKLENDVEFVRAIASRFVMHLLMPGTTIMQEGEEANDMFFISKGEASILGGEGEELHVLRQGSFFGEKGLLFGTRRERTVVAKTLCQVYALSREDFDAIIDLRPEALGEVLAVTKDLENDAEVSMFRCTVEGPERSRSDPSAEELTSMYYATRSRAGMSLTSGNYIPPAAFGVEAERLQLSGGPSALAALHEHQYVEEHGEDEEEMEELGCREDSNVTARGISPRNSLPNGEGVDVTDESYSSEEPQPDAPCISVQ